VSLGDPGREQRALAALAFLGKQPGDAAREERPHLFGCDPRREDPPEEPDQAARGTKPPLSGSSRTRMC
jgi:hypothetical protein